MCLVEYYQRNTDLLDSLGCFRPGHLHFAREADGDAAAGEQKDRSEAREVVGGGDRRHEAGRCQPGFVGGAFSHQQVHLEGGDDASGDVRDSFRTKIILKWLVGKN